MILYKYVSYAGGRAILHSETAGFSQPRHLNDPFEVSAAFPDAVDGDPLRFLDEIRLDAKRGILAENYAILSLTRSALNPLMWAHYAEQHQGFVIGYDCSCDALSSVTQNTVPVQFGGIIYTATKPTHAFIQRHDPFRIAEQVGFDHQYFERLQRAFLYKPLCWSYEEEVRVVKCVRGIEPGENTRIGNLQTVVVGGRPLYLIALPKGAVKEVYLGVRNSLLGERRDELQDVRAQVPEARFYRCEVGRSDWSLVRAAVEPV